jgi:sorbitol/mannitol transport system substrate-binding protein
VRGRAPDGPTRARPRRGRLALLSLLGIALLGAVTACSGAGALGGEAGAETVTVAIVSNPQMEDAIKLAPEFEKENPGIRMRFVSLSENEARAKITASVATGGGEFDVVMISNYETPQWAQNGWIEDLQPMVNATPGYDGNDFIPTVRNSLSYNGDMYAVPFYGESSFLMYRTDLFQQAGLTMPANPTWAQVADMAAKLTDRSKGQAGICLRGKPGWGEMMAPFNTVVNTFGGRWYDPQWNAQLTSPQFEQATQFYTDLVRNYGEPGAAQAGFSECGTQFGQGNAAMWYDATSAAGTVEDPSSSTVVGKVGFAPAPVVATPSSGWLYTWSLAIPKTSPRKDAAWKFMSWMTSKEYMQRVGTQLGWTSLPPGSRLSTYQIPQYQQAGAAFAPTVLNAIQSANPQQPTVQPVPYQGVQFLRIPEFQDLGTRVSQQLSAAIAGQKTPQQALEQSQEYATTVGESYQ